MKNIRYPIRIAEIPGDWLGGGIESVVFSYYKKIDKSKIQFDFLCSEKSNAIPYEEIEKMGGRVIILPNISNLPKYVKVLTRILRENNYAVVHSHISVLSVFSLYSAKKAGVPVRIAHAHTTSNRKDVIKNTVKNILRPFSRLFSTDYFACSEKAGRWLFGNKAYENGLVYLQRNAIDSRAFSYNAQVRNEMRNKLGIDSDTFAVGHVGRFVTPKNHLFLLEVFSEILKIDENCVLILAGIGPLYDSAIEKAHELGIESKVKFLGFRDDVADLIQMFDVFLMPSLYEGLPVVGVEAQASGIPCIFSENVTREAKILDETLFLSLNKSAKEWAEKTIAVYKCCKREDGSDKVREMNFDVTAEAQKLCEKYILLYNRAME